jgi:uncharacterized protein (DUF362 family)
MAERAGRAGKPAATESLCAVATGLHPHLALEEALERGGVWGHLRSLTGDADPQELRVFVLPDLSLFEPEGPTGTEPALVEHLVDLLAERGFGSVTVGSGPDATARFLDNRDVLVVADLAGYRFVTDHDNPYDVVDLSEDLVEAPFPPSSALHGSTLAEAWVDADVRISFAKNKTHAEHGFALTVHNLLAVLPLRDRAYHYRARLKPWDTCVDLLRAMPVHVAIVDAVVSNHGSMGDRAPRPLRTDTVIAGTDPVLVDFVAAAKMGTDPYASPVNAKALRDVGLPARYRILGDLAPYEGWENVHPLQASALRRIDESPRLATHLLSATVRPDPERFPFTRDVNDRVNRASAPMAASPWAVWGYAWLAAMVDGVEAWRTLVAKDALHRREVPLDLDLSSYSRADYDAVVEYLAPLEQLVAAMPPDEHGLRWRYLDGSVLFHYAKVLPVDFDRFVDVVPVRHAITWMKDYIGGHTVAIHRDRKGRVTHQAERNIYLPQPNWLVLYGGSAIDVAKLEAIHYGEDEHKIVWRTVHSSNDSATHDDGSVRFARTGSGTEVTVMARQKFRLPPLWEAVDLDLFPEIKDRFVGAEYFKFFDETIDNFSRAYTGEDVQIGRAWDPAHGEDGDEEDELDIVVRARQMADRFRSRRDPGGTVDEHGFRHFEGGGHEGSGEPDGNRFRGGLRRAASSDVSAWWSDLARQAGKDLGVVVPEE